MARLWIALVAVALATSGCDLISADRSGRGEADTLAGMRSDPRDALRTALVRAEKMRSVSYTTALKTDKGTNRGRGKLSFGPPARGEDTTAYVAGTRPGRAAGTETALTVGTVRYTRTTDEQRAVFGKAWTSFDVAKAMAVNGLPQLGPEDPHLRPAVHLKTILESGTPEVVGEESVEGVRTLRFTRTIALGDYEKHAHGAVSPAVGTQPTSPFDLWVDAEFRLRKMALGGDLVVIFLDFDRPVHVTAPPAGEVVDVSTPSR